MNSTETLNINRIFISLSASVINQTELQSYSLSDEEMKKLYSTAISHQMIGIIATALESAGIIDEKFIQSRERIILYDRLLDKEREKVLNELGKEHIWYLPLKGIVLKKYYPQPWMRQMADNDILFDSSRAKDMYAIMKKLGFSCTHEAVGHQDDYIKKPCFHFEMHRMLFSSKSDKKIFVYFQDIDKRLQGTGLEKSMSNEDFYIYMIAHEYKHYYWMGTGLRSLLDVYVYLKCFYDELDWLYIHQEIRKMGIEHFEEKNRRLAYKVFSEGNIDDLTEDEYGMLMFFVGSGMYGTKEHENLNYILKYGSIRYLLHKLFPPLKEVKEFYPFFYENWVLIPFLPFYRIYKRKNTVKMLIKILFHV